MQSNRNNKCIIPTADGSNTLVHPGNGQSYHSMNGALQEARHVFLQNGLIHFLEQSGLTSARILEVGFGAGLNFTVSAAYCLENSLSLQYTGIEPFPIGKNLLEESGYTSYLPDVASQQAFLEWYPSETPLVLPPLSPVEGNAGVTLHLLRQPVLDTGPLPSSDVIYFDAFAPAVQPGMWTQEVISHVTSSLSTGGVFVSYSITGKLKRILKELGFAVEKPEGAAGKREMIRATRSVVTNKF